MPDGIASCASSMRAFPKAQAAVNTWLAAQGVHVDAVAADDLATRYPSRGFASGWRLAIQFSDQIRRLELLLPTGFPWQPPRVALLDRPPFLTWPHVERDGVLCLAPNTFEIDPDEPARAAAFLLKEAEQAVQHFIAGAGDGDFKDEFASYWDWGSDAGPRVISLLRPAPPTRSVRLWRGKHFHLLAETDAELQQWLTNKFGKAPDEFRPVPGAVLCLAEPPIPRHYPNTATSLRALLGSVQKDATELLLQLARGAPDKIFAALGVETANGPAIGSVIIPAPAAIKHGARDPLTKGFRPHALPEAILLARYFGGTTLIRRPVERADAAWVHGRG
jgi:sulfur-carrier protein adenylyltransferase/sulfurtransferase